MTSSARIALGVCALFLAGAAQAQDEHGHAAEELTMETAPAQANVSFACQFDVECVEDEPCAATDYVVEIDGRAGGMDTQSMVIEATLSSIAGNVPVLGVRDGAALSLSGGPFEARHLMTIAPEGAARYSVHYVDGPMVLSYLGHCDGRQ